jgi:hypothetical protein
MLATYAYAMQFLTERDLRYPAIVGNLLYAVALVIPMLYVALLIVTYGVHLLQPALKNPVVQTVISGLTSAILGAASFDVVRRLGQSLGRNERKATSEQLERANAIFSASRATL